jgi:AbrB family looped-hinge helix DNA binding protein
MTHPLPSSVETLRVGPQGRVLLPSRLRKALGLKPGDTLVAWQEGDTLVLRSRNAIKHELWKMFEHVEGSMAEELIRERREEAARDAPG